MLSVEATECKPLSERIKNVEANYIMQSGRWILSAYQFSGKWDNENNAVRRNLNAWVRPALRFVQRKPNVDAARSYRDYTVTVADTLPEGVTCERLS